MMDGVAIKYDPSRYRFEAARPEMCAREAMRAGRLRSASSFVLRAQQCRAAWWRHLVYEGAAAVAILAIVVWAAAMVARSI